VRFAGSGRGNAPRGQRNRHRLVPASSGAKASLACEERQLVGCARASTSVAEVGERRPGSEKHDPLANGACGRGSGSLVGFRKGLAGGSKALTTSIAVAKPRSWERPEPGVRKDVAGQRFSLDGRHPRSIFRWARSRELAGGGLGGSRRNRERANGHGAAGEATGVSEARYARITAGRQRPPR